MAIFIAVCAALIGLIAWFGLAQAPQETLGFLPGSLGEIRVFLLSLGYLCMVFGMVLGVLARALMRMRDLGQDEVDIRAFVRSSFRRVDFWLSLFASPVIYGGILTSRNLGVHQFCYFALQSGFSSYVVIRALLEGGGRSQTHS